MPFMEQVEEWALILKTPGWLRQRLNCELGGNEEPG